MNAEFRERLGVLDTCALSDAGDAIGLRTWVPGLVSHAASPRIVGRCVTVELGPPRPDAPKQHLCTRAIENAGPGDVIVVAHQGRRDCAGWGGNLSRAAKQRRVEGTIVHGAVRDVDEAHAIDYAIFAVAPTPVTARGRTQELSWGRSVDLDGLSVSTGDWVVADRSGVVFIPVERADELVDRAELIARREAAMAAAIDAGKPVGTVMGADYESMLEEHS